MGNVFIDGRQNASQSLTDELEAQFALRNPFELYRADGYHDDVRPSMPAPTRHYSRRREDDLVFAIGEIAIVAISPVLNPVRIRFQI